MWRLRLSRPQGRGIPQARAVLNRQGGDLCRSLRTSVAPTDASKELRPTCVGHIDRQRSACGRLVLSVNEVVDYTGRFVLAHCVASAAAATRPQPRQRKKGHVPYVLSLPTSFTVQTSWTGSFTRKIHPSFTLRLRRSRRCRIKPNRTSSARLTLSRPFRAFAPQPPVRAGP